MGTTRGPTAGRPVALEVVGPPGSGKTTLVGALPRSASAAGGAPATPVSVYCNRRNAPAWLGASPAAAPLVARQLGRMSAQELRWVMRLEASPRILRRQWAAGRAVLVLDQGPVFTMVRIMESAAAAPWRHPFEGWWERTLRRWAGTLDLLVLLDAPDDVLLPRINGRAKVHGLKHAPEAAGRLALAAERARYDAVAELLRARGPVRVVRFDSSGASPDELSARTLEALGVSDAGPR